MYIIYNEDGSIKSKQLNEFIQQGNSYANFIEIYLLGKEPSDYHLLAHFTLDNGFETNTFLDEECEMEFEGETIYGRKLSLTKNETALAGKLKLNIQALENETDIVLTTYTVYLSINEGVEPGELGYMSQEQAQQILDGLGDAVSQAELNAVNEDLQAHKENKSNPHEVSKSQVGLGSVVNTGDSATPTENGTDKFTTGGAWAMDQRVSALENIGRFLSLWNSTTGEAVSNPPSSPYTYHTGDYFRISVGGSRIPNGSSYTIGGTNYTTYAGTLQIGDVVYYDGTTWVVQAGSGQGNVVDVQVNGNSIVSAGTANLLTATLRDIIYPIGSIYSTVDSTFDPATAFGGTWVALNSGNAIKLPTSDIPVVATGNSHTIEKSGVHIVDWDGNIFTSVAVMGAKSGGTNPGYMHGYTGIVGGTDAGVATFDNLWAIPTNYESVYMWKRTA